MKKIDDSLKLSIIKTLCFFLLFQSLFLIILAILIPISIFFLFFFLTFNVIYHLVILWILIKNAHLFTITPSNVKLKKVNIGNLLTLMRMSAMPNILALILLHGTRQGNKAILPFLIIALFIVFATDFFDGFISRKRGECTQLGSILDSTSDYLILFVITIAFFVKNIIGPIIFTIIFTRGISVVIASMVFLKFNHESEVESTYLGKLSVFIIMSLYALELLAKLSFPMLKQPLGDALTTGICAALHPLEWIACTIVLISIGDKVLFFGKKIQTFLRLHKK